MKILRKLYSSKNKERKIPTSLKFVGGIGVVPVGVELLKDSNKSGELSGRVKLYHGTNAKAKESILREGLKGKYALDPNNLTNTVIDNIGVKDGRKLVYTSRVKDPAEIMANINEQKGRGKASIVEMSIPYDEYKKMKRIYDNPEFKGTTNYKDWLKKIKRDPDPYLEAYYNNFSGAKGTKGTRIFEQDIKTTRIKGSKDYVKNSAKEIYKYAKRNPKRFGKALGKASLGTGLIISGGLLAASDKLKKNK